MARVYGEPVEVQTREDGRPSGFVWRSRVYSVRSVQEYWVVNRDWWREADPVPGRPELQFWRVEASAGPGGTGGTGGATRAAQAAQPGGTYELRRDVENGTWTLRQIAD